jgi:hypothetical protein
MSKMTSHEPFGHLKPKLWAKERSGVKLLVWLPTTKSWESTSSRCLQKECNRELKRSRGELQLWFRPHSDRRLEPGDMSSQSPKSPTWGSFGTPPWESREKMPFRCGSREELQRILYGGRWWLPSSPGRGESSESKVARGLSQHQMDPEWVLTNLGLVLDAGSCNNIIVPLPSLISGLLACPSYLQCWKSGVAPSSNFSQFNILRPSSGSNKELRNVSWAFAKPKHYFSYLDRHTFS